MRNALVLVPLCIGLTSGFIVPTSTSDANNLNQPMTTSKLFNVETSAIDEEINTKKSTDSIDFTLHLQKIKGDGVQQELYNEGSDVNKSIEERSFILVNQRWSKQPYKSHLIDAKLSNSFIDGQNLKKSSYLHVFQEDPRENVVPDMGAAYEKYLNRQEQYNEQSKARNKSSFASNKIESKIHLNYGTNSKNYEENRLTGDKNNFVELIKSSLTRPSMKNYENIASRENIKSKHSSNVNKKHFIEFNSENSNVEVIKNKRQNTTKQHKGELKNTPLPEDKLQEIANEPYLEFAADQKLFHLLLEEQVPYKQTVYRNNSNSLSSFKYCRKCVRLAKLSNINYVDKECDCKCGRYIHLKGRIENN